MKFVVCTGFALILGNLPLPVRGAETWLSGLAPSMFATMQPETQSDFMALFHADAAWPQAASTIQVFKIYSQFVSAASDEDLRQAFSDLQRRRIALAIEAGVMTANNSCGRVEGYDAVGAPTRLAERIRRLGGELRYVAMDEPLWFGHRFNGATACNTPIPELARDVAANVAAFKRVFPAVQIGDIEPFGNSEPAGWIDEIMQWTHAYKEAVGESLAFFHLDMSWSAPWHQQTSLLVPRLHAAGIKFGIIYNGDPDDPTDLAWTRHAEQRVAMVEADQALLPDQAILQTWMPRPSHMLPESEPGSMTWLVNRYHATQTRIVLRRAGDWLQGQLTDVTGRPLAGATVTLSAQLLGEAGAPVVHTRSGRVPQKAAVAILAIRVNAECSCFGPADIAIGPMRYHDDRTGQTIQRTFRESAVLDNIATLARFRAETGQKIMQNAPGFPVTADNRFTIQVPMRMDLASVGSGYVALVFLDAQGKEVERIRLPFELAERPIGTLTTDAQGRFSHVPDPATLRASVVFRAEFLGDAQHRTTAATLR